MIEQKINSHLYFSRIRQIINSFQTSIHIELQQRGVEFSQLFGKYGTMRNALLERMPPMEIARQQSDDSPINNYEIEDVDQPTDSPVHQTDSVSIISTLVYMIKHLNCFM